MSDIREIKERVRSLLMKAADAAASPSEADAAMRMAQKLMSKYQVKESDLGSLTGDDYKEYDRPNEYHKTKGWYMHPVDRYCAVAVGKFCAVIPYTAMDGDKQVLRLFGLESDVELASWMLTAFRQQLDHDWLIFKRFQMQSKRLLDVKEARKSFVQGFTKAVSQRLDDWMFRDTPKSPSEGSGNGRDLVIRKANLAMDELNRRGVYLSASRGKRTTLGTDTAAAGAGMNSGRAAQMGGAKVGGAAIAIGR